MSEEQRQVLPAALPAATTISTSAAAQALIPPAASGNGQDRAIASVFVDAPAEGMFARAKRLLRGRWWWALLLGGLLGTPTAVLGWRAGERTYASRGQVHVAPYVDDFGLAAGDRTLAFGSYSYESFLDTQVQFARTARVIEKAMSDPAWRALNRPFSEQAVRDFGKNLLIARKGEVLLIEFHDTDPQAAQVGARCLIDAFEQLNAEEDSQRGKGKMEFLQAELARSLNRLSQLDDSVRSKLRELKGYESFTPDDLNPLLATKLADASMLATRLREVRWELAVRQGTAGTATPAPAPAPGTQPAPAVADAAGGSDAAPQNGARAASAPQQASAITEPSVEEIALENSQMAMYLSQKRELEATLRRLSQRYGSSHSMVKAVEMDVATVDGAIRDFAKLYTAWRGKQGAALRDASSLQRLEANLMQGLNETNAQIDAVTRLKRDLQIIREQSEQEKLNRDELKKKMTAQERLARVPGRVRILDPASPPGTPYSDSRPQLAALGITGGMLVGFGVMLLVGLADRRLRVPDDARRLGLGNRPIIGLLPEVLDDLSDPAQVERAAHCVHGVRTSLQLWYGWLSNPVFAVTGASVGTGKTTLTLALGLSFAAARSRTLLIDFDLVGAGLTRRTEAVKRRMIGQILRQAGLLKHAQLKAGLRLAASSGTRLGEALVQLGVLGEPDLAVALRRQERDAMGVLDVLDGEKLRDCVADTEIPNLAILPVGQARTHHVGTVSPLRIQQLLDAARAAYDVVLIDTGPIPGSLEGAAVAAAADGVVLAVSRGDPKAAIVQCADHLQSVGARLAGVVFNRASARNLADAAKNGSGITGFGSSTSQSGVRPWPAADEIETATAGGGDAAVGDAGATDAADGADAASGGGTEPWHDRFGPFGRAVARAASLGRKSDRQR